MTEEQWKEINQLEQFDVDIYWELYKEKGGTANEEEFVEAFKPIINGQILAATGTDRKPKRVDLETATNRVKQFYNNKFKQNG